MTIQTSTVSANEIEVGALLLWADGEGAPVETLRVSEVKPEHFLYYGGVEPVPVDYITGYVLDLARLNDGSYRGSISVKPEQILTVLPLTASA